MTGSERGWLRDLLGGRRNRGPIPRRARGWGVSRGLEALETRWLMAVFVPPKVIEGKGPVRNTADFIIRPERSVAKPTTYSLIAGGGIATSGTDYVLTQKTVTFQPGDKKQVVSVGIIDDELIEHDEDFFLVVKGPGRPFFGRAIIIDDDTPGPPLHVGHPIVPEGGGPIPASRVRFLSPARIHRMARDYDVQIAGR
jgi:hypothetical protein